MSGADLELDQDGRLQRVLAVMSDEPSREILSTLTEPRTASELVDRCEIPSSTVYRKLETLERTGLIRECVAVQPGYGPVRRFELTVDRVEISIDDGEFSIAVERQPRAADEELP